MDDLLENIIRALDKLRARSPLVHCLTNEVVKQFTANVLLAVGAAPAMVEHSEEAAEFAAVADALLVNLGTLSEVQIQSILSAVPEAVNAGKPWVLDPVAVGAIGLRTRFAYELLEKRPTIIRGNASEILALAGRTGKGRGVDSLSESADAIEAAQLLATDTGSIVFITGATDYIVTNSSAVAIRNGDPMLTRITGAGCALGALTAAFASVCDFPVVAATAASLMFSVAGELAAAESRGPGTFAVRLLDQLYSLDGETLAKRGNISTL
jgi:hydroxyethylthiazole kinase